MQTLGYGLLLTLTIPIDQDARDIVENIRALPFDPSVNVIRHICIVYAL